MMKLIRLARALWRCIFREKPTPEAPQPPLAPVDPLARAEWGNAYADHAVLDAWEQAKAMGAQGEADAQRQIEAHKKKIQEDLASGKAVRYGRGRSHLIRYK